MLTNVNILKVDVAYKKRGRLTSMQASTGRTKSVVFENL
jgi:hypothetical protein